MAGMSGAPGEVAPPGFVLGVKRAGAGNADSFPPVEGQERRPWFEGFTFVCVSRSRRICHGLIIVVGLMG